MRLKAQHSSIRNAAKVTYPCSRVKGGEIVCTYGYADVVTDDEEGLLAAMENGEYPLSGFAVASESEAHPSRVKTMLSAAGDPADVEDPGLTWLAWTEALKAGFSAKSLKNAALLGLVRTKEVDSKTVYCGEDLKTTKEKQAR